MTGIPFPARLKRELTDREEAKVAVYRAELPGLICPKCDNGVVFEGCLNCDRMVCKNCSSSAWLGYIARNKVANLRDSSYCSCCNTPDTMEKLNLCLLARSIRAEAARAEAACVTELLARFAALAEEPFAAQAEEPFTAQAEQPFAAQAEDSFTAMPEVSFAGLPEVSFAEFHEPIDPLGEIDAQFEAAGYDDECQAAEAEVEPPGHRCVYVPQFSYNPEAASANSPDVEPEGCHKFSFGQKLK